MGLFTRIPMGTVLKDSLEGVPIEPLQVQKFRWIPQMLCKSRDEMQKLKAKVQL